MNDLAKPGWPKRFSVMGVPVSSTTYSEAVERLMTAATMRQPALATALAVHGGPTLMLKPANIGATDAAPPTALLRP